MREGSYIRYCCIEIPPRLEPYGLWSRIPVLPMRVRYLEFQKGGTPPFTTYAELDAGLPRCGQILKRNFFAAATKKHFSDSLCTNSTGTI